MCALNAKSGLNIEFKPLFQVNSYNKRLRRSKSLHCESLLDFFNRRGFAALSRPVDYLMIVPIVLGAIPAAFASSVSMCIARA